MDRLNRQFLNIMRKALRGESLRRPTDLTEAEWIRLMDLAQSHHVLPLVYEAVHSLPELENAAFLLPIRQTVRQQIMIQTQKTCDFLELTRQLDAADLHPLVVKGIICRSLYPCPDHRISSDEDLLIPSALFASCHQAMLQYGMEPFGDSEASSARYEIPYRKKNGLLYIELHRHLFPPESAAYGDLNRFFQGVFQRSTIQTIDGVPVHTMGCTDHLFYLICHAFKHFLHSGFGIRQVCDIVMYANAYGAQTDWQEILNHCQVIHADRFAAALFQIGRKYLGFDPQKACYPSFWQDIAVDETAMLEDLLCSGVYGSSNRSRLHSSNITLDAVAARKQQKKTGSAVLVSLFPSARNLEKQYPYLKEHPYLLPAAWVSRICKYCIESKGSRQNNASEALKIGNRRVALLKEYGIIE